MSNEPDHYYGEYRKIEYERTHKGVWLFRSFLPGSALRWHSWSRFFTRTEQYKLDDISGFFPEQNIIMKTAIDRAYRDQPIYTGDIRDRSYYED